MLCTAIMYFFAHFLEQNYILVYADFIVSVLLPASYESCSIMVKPARSCRL
jgi:hypothetical protein